MDPHDSSQVDHQQKVRQHNQKSTETDLFFIKNQVHPVFGFFGHFWRRSYKNMKISRNICLHFARQKTDRQKKKQKENHTTKVTKIPKTKRRKYGINKTLVMRFLI